MHSRSLESGARSVRLSKLLANTRYRVCVLGLGGWLGGPELAKPSRAALLRPDPSSTRCAEALTLEPPDLAVASSDGSSLSAEDAAAAAAGKGSGAAGPGGGVLTRRLGLIVGCCMGFVVFVLLVSVLGYLKVSGFFTIRLWVIEGGERV